MGASDANWTGCCGKEVVVVAVTVACEATEVTRVVSLCGIEAWGGSVPGLKTVFIGADGVDVFAVLCETLTGEGIRGVFISYFVPGEGAAKINPCPHGVIENRILTKLRM